MKSLLLVVAPCGLCSNKVKRRHAAHATAAGRRQNSRFVTRARWPFLLHHAGDFGAQVVKVEVPGAGDIARGWGPPFYKTETAYFVSLHRNKKSIEIDFKKEAGKELFFRMVERFDVVLENYRVGTLDKLGIAYDKARVRNPGIIYCSVSGFGQTGPYRDRAALDSLCRRRAA